MTGANKSLTPQDIITAAASSPASISQLTCWNATGDDSFITTPQIMSMLMAACLTHRLDVLWEASKNLMHHQSMALEEILRWARTPGAITDPAVAAFVARYFRDVQAKDPGKFNSVCNGYATTGSPIEVLILYLAGARLPGPPRTCPPPNMAIVKAYQSEHGRFVIESRFGPLEKLLLDHDYKTFYLAFFRNTPGKDNSQ